MALFPVYRHHVDASYYGAERTGFLKHKRGRINRSSVNLASSYLQSGTNTNDSLEPLEVIKQEIVPMELVRCNRSDEDADGEDDTVLSIHYISIVTLLDYQKLFIALDT